MNTEFKYLNTADVLQKTGLSKSTFFKLRQAKKFPEPRRLGASPVWLENDIETYIKTAPPRLRTKKDQHNFKKTVSETYGEPLLTTMEVAARLGISKSKIYVMTKQGNLPKPIQIHRRTFFRSSAIEGYIRTFLATEPPTKLAIKAPARLLKLYAKYDSSCFGDEWLMLASELESALASGGGVPGKDYKILDLFSLTREAATANYLNGKTSIVSSYD